MSGRIMHVAPWAYSSASVAVAISTSTCAIGNTISIASQCWREQVASRVSSGCVVATAPLTRLRKTQCF